MKGILHLKHINKQLNLSFCRWIGILMFLSFFSCQKAPINGELDGQWEVMEVSPAPIYTPIQVALYYNFYGHVCMLSYYGGTYGYANMIYNGTNMTLDFKEEAPLGNLEWIYQYGILTNPVTFNVEFTDSHHLILSNNESTVVLVKH